MPVNWRFTMKARQIFSGLLLVMLLTACGKDAAQEQTTVPAQSSEEIAVTNTETDTAETTAAFNTDELADIYAHVVMERIEFDRKTKDEYIRFRPLYDDDLMRNNSLMFLLDVDFDNTPELFIGTATTTGGGCYDIVKSDGIVLGKDVHCCSWLDDGCIIDGVMYMFNGRGSNPGWVKLVDGTPNIMVDNWINEEEAVNTVKVTNVDGTVKTYTDQSIDDIKALYTQFLNVDYDLLMSVSGTLEYTCLCGTLRVPDPENYTEEDIYNCLVELLAEYEELVVKQ